MKKTVALLITFTTIITLSVACQPTPEQEAVVGKGEEKIEAMLEKAIDTQTPTQEGGEPQHTELQYDAPEKLEYNFESDIEGAAMKIRVNAPVVLPQYTLPIVKVRPKDITYGQLSAFLGLIENGRPIYQREYTEMIQLKKDIQHRIDVYMWEIAMCEGEPDAKDTATQYQNLINDLYKELESAPETYEEASLINEGGDANQTKKDPNATPAPGVTPVLGMTQEYTGQFEFTQENFAQRTYNLIIGTGYDADTLSFAAKNGRESCPSIRYVHPSFEGLSSKSVRTKNAPDVMDGFAFSEEAALATANEYAGAVDETLTFSAASEAIYTDFSKDDNPSFPFGYTFFYTRKYSGVATNYAEKFTLNNDIMAATGETGAYQKPYPQEYLAITVGEEGIYSLTYTSPLEVTETVSTNVELLPFDKIKEKFEQYIVLNSWGEDSTIYLNIERIELGLMRIAQPNSDEYLVVPVWDFYGSSILSSERTEYTDQEYWDMISHFYGRSYLTINAIDGSIIDRELGY